MFIALNRIKSARHFMDFPTLCLANIKTFMLLSSPEKNSGKDKETLCRAYINYAREAQKLWKTCSNSFYRFWFFMVDRKTSKKIPKFMKHVGWEEVGTSLFKMNIHEILSASFYIFALLSRDFFKDSVTEFLSKEHENVCRTKTNLSKKKTLFVNVQRSR